MNLRTIAAIAGVAVIFALGWNASGYIWSAKYDKLDAAHEKAVADMQARVVERQNRINAETQEREEQLLRDLEITREAHAILQGEINETPLVLTRTVRVPGDCPEPAPAVDWSTFGRLYDASADPGRSSPAGETAGGDAAGETAPDSG